MARAKTVQKPKAAAKKRPKAKKPVGAKESPTLLLSPFCYSGPGLIDPKLIEAAVKKVRDERLARERAAAGE